MVWSGVVCGEECSKDVLNPVMHARLQVLTPEGYTCWRCTNLVLCVHAADHAVAAKLLFDRAIATVRTLFEPRAHHFLCPLLIPNLRRMSDVLSSVMTDVYETKYKKTVEIADRVFFVKP